MWIKVGRAVVDALARFIQSGRFDMNAITKSEMITRRKAVSLMGLAAAFGFAAAPRYWQYPMLRLRPQPLRPLRPLPLRPRPLAWRGVRRGVMSGMTGAPPSRRAHRA